MSISISLLQSPISSLKRDWRLRQSHCLSHFRQRLFRNRGGALGPGLQPVPHMVLVLGEFGALLAEGGEFGVEVPCEDLLAIHAADARRAALAVDHRQVGGGGSLVGRG